MADLRRLGHFVTLADTLNFSRAAERLNMAQPALSVSIRRLEEDIGVPLFIREARGVRLTASGEVAVALARRTLFHAQQTAEAARTAAVGASGTLRVGFIASATFGLLQRIIPPFSHAFPAVELVLRETNSSRTIALWLQEGEIDIGIVRTPLVESYKAKFLELQSDRLIAALPSSHPLAGARSLELADLAREKFVMYRHTEASGIRSAAMLACQQAGFFPEIAQEAVQINTLLSLVESGLGVGLVPSIVKDFAGDRIAYRAFGHPPEATRVGLSMIYVEDREVPAAQRFRLSVRETLRV